MSIVVAGFDIHRSRIAFDALDTETGEISTGRIDATPAAVEKWVKRFPTARSTSPSRPAPAGKTRSRRRPLGDALEERIAPVEREPRRFSRRRAGRRVLTERRFGIGEPTAPVIVAELGDACRLRRSRRAVRMAGLDVGVSRSDRRGGVGGLTKRGSPHLRRAPYESARAACRQARSPRLPHPARAGRGGDRFRPMIAPRPEPHRSKPRRPR
jgi:hypothetical protein